ncbi:MAG: uridine diphosphate-N-acetylglucosamine-binding protein YvcK [Clostridia bacterium]|nr:uridine diphosphate-N-acetylglucosamine-binding protein YvcK [Clostridia bacterium]
MKGLFEWFKNSSKMKRWILLILIGVVLVSYGIANIITSTNAITFKHAAKIIIFFTLGFTAVILGLIYLNKRTMELFVEATDDRISRKKKVNINSLIFNKNIYEQGPNIVVIGGGSGLNTILDGLKRYTSNITAIVTVSNYGENLAKDTEKLRYLQLEDIKNGLASLATQDNSKIPDLLNYRFKKGTLKNIAFSDIYFEAMKDISKSLAESVKNSNDIFKIYGKVLPVTEDEMKICAELGNGYVVEEKSKIASMVYDKLTKISRVYLSPSNCKPTLGVVEAIQNADSIIIGPGSLYTNIIPNLLVNGVARAIKDSKAKKFYVCNIMTEPGLTDNYSVADHINSIIDHCGEGLIDYCLYDTGEVIPEYIKKYNLDGADLVEQDLRNVKDRRIKFIKENLSLIKDDSVRHNANLIADIVIQVICDDLKYMDKQNDPEYMMMNSKLKADKAINRKKRKASKEKTSGKKREKVGNSKFATKYQERIKSIKDSSKSVEKRRKGAQSKAKQQKITNTDDIDILKEQEKYAQENQTPVYSEVLKIKNYEEIRKEMLKKFNKSKS